MYEKEAALFKALADENRLSYHMSLLCASGMVCARRQGRWTYYSLSREGCDSVRSILEAITCTCTDPRCRAAAAQK